MPSVTSSCPPDKSRKKASKGKRSKQVRVTNIRKKRKTVQDMDISSSSENEEC
jgi:hypothetical protein